MVRGLFRGGVYDTGTLGCSARSGAVPRRGSASRRSCLRCQLYFPRDQANPLSERAHNQQREAIVEVLHQATRWAATVGRIGTETMQVRALEVLGSEEAHRLGMIQMGQEVISTHSVTAAEFDRSLLTAEILTTDREIQGHISDLRKAFEDSFDVVTYEVEFAPRAEMASVQVTDSMKVLGDCVAKLRNSAVVAFRPSSPDQ